MGKAKQKPLIPMDHPITIAVMPLKSLACDRAESAALEDINGVRTELESTAVAKSITAGAA